MNTPRPPGNPPHTLTCCPLCRYDHSAAAPRCPECGADLADAEARLNPPRTPPPDTDALAEDGFKVTTVQAALLGLCLTAGLGLYFVINARDRWSVFNGAVWLVLAGMHGSIVLAELRAPEVEAEGRARMRTAGTIAAWCATAAWAARSLLE